ncbi:MAG: preprotein translocase subunit SecE [Endomicrobiales bacterium]|nr:preprotein translocase subunit SecE [Endomicrobiales bacterium]
MNEWLRNAVQFVKEAIGELKKVTWLSKKEVLASTIVVILLVSIIALFVGFADFILSKILAILL